MINKFIKLLANNERGTSAVEMGLLCALLVIAMMAGLESFANQNASQWNTVSGSMANASAP